MPLFKLDIQKRVGNEYWTNVYYADATDLSSAVGALQDIAAMEQTIHVTRVFFDSGRVSTAVEGDEVTVSVPLSGTGARAVANPLPLFNTLNGVLPTLASGRPSRKFWRGVLGTNDIVFDAVDPGSLAVFQAALDNAFAGFPAANFTLVDVDGQPITAITLVSKVGMRQLRRGSRRRTQPII